MKKVKYILPVILVVLSMALTLPIFTSAGNGNELYIKADKKQEIVAGTALTDQQLLSLFNVSSNYKDLFNGKMTIEHSIDFNTPGKYNIKFIASYQEVKCVPKNSGNPNVNCDDNGNGNGNANGHGSYQYIDHQKVAVSKLTITKPSPKIEIFSDNNKGAYEYTTYTNEQLISLYNVQVTGNENNLPIQVSHSIDFTKVGTYEVVFTVGDVSKTVTYEVKDLLPILLSDNEHTIKVNQSIDYLSAYNVNAYELNNYDLNNYVIINDSKVDYTKPGDYEVTFSVEDNDGNVVIKHVVLHIVQVDTINSKQEQIIELGTTYTVEELKNIFELTANYSLNLANVSVTEAIDYNTVGEYEIIFKDTTKNVETKSTLKIVKDIQTKLELEKICTKVGVQLTKEQYIAAYEHEHGKIEDTKIIETLTIDDSVVNYDEEGTYQVNVHATNNAGDDINVVVALCVQKDTTTDPDPDETCKKYENGSDRVEKVSITQSDVITDSKLRELFAFDDSFSVVHNINPEAIGVYSILFSNNKCNFNGQVEVLKTKVISDKETITDELKDKNLTNVKPEDVKEGRYNIRTIDGKTDQDKMEVIEYSIKDTGNSSYIILATIIATLAFVLKSSLNEKDK